MLPSPSIPPPPSSEEEKLADKHLVEMRKAFGDARTEHLSKCIMSIGQYLVMRTLNIDEGLMVISHIKESLELAVKIDKELAAKEANNTTTTNDPTAN